MISYGRQGLGNIRHDIISPIVDKLRFRNEELGFDGRVEKSMSTNITFVKEKDMVQLEI